MNHRIVNVTGTSKFLNSASTIVLHFGERKVMLSPREWEDVESLDNTLKELEKLGRLSILSLPISDAEFKAFLITLDRPLFTSVDVGPVMLPAPAGVDDSLEAWGISGQNEHVEETQEIKHVEAVTNVLKVFDKKLAKKKKDS